MRRVSNILIIIALLCAGAAVYLLWQDFEPHAPGFSGAEAAIGGPFALVDQFGHSRTDRDFRGHYLLLYFGYTYCPDVCPTTLAVMAKILANLGGKAERITPVFITVDPARDTPAVLKAYLAVFGSRFVGLTGTPAQIAKVAHEYRVYYARHPLPGGTYSVDHSSAIYLIDPGGKFAKAYDGDAGAAPIVKDLQSLL